MSEAEVKAVHDSLEEIMGDVGEQVLEKYPEAYGMTLTFMSLEGRIGCSASYFSNDHEHIPYPAWVFLHLVNHPEDLEEVAGILGPRIIDEMVRH